MNKEQERKRKILEQSDNLKSKGLIWVDLLLNALSLCAPLLLLNIIPF